ncbi:MAG: MFS transporter [Betaproteobacteria bacterium]|jgi:MFS family permease|nr:MFS transporter [Betaproteobacteria bacterium]
MSGQEPAPRTVAAVVAATTAAQVSGAMGAAVFPVIAPELARSLGVESSLIGYQMSVIYGAAMLGSMLFTWMVARYGGCRTTQIGMVCCAAGMAVALQGSITALVLASLLIGAGMSINLPAAAHLLFRYSPPRHRNFIFSLKQTGVPLAWALMALIAPPVTLAWGWRWALVFVLASALLTLLAMQPPRAAWDDDRRPDRAVQMRVFDGVLLVWRIPVLRWLGVSAFCLAFIQLCLSTFTVVMLVGEGGYTLVQAGLMLSVAQVAGVLGRIAWGWFADRSGDCMASLQYLTLASIACSGIIMFLTPGWPVLLTALLFAVFGATAIGWNGLYTAEVARRSPEGQVSLVTGGAMVWNFAGILSGPTAFTLAYKSIGSYTATFALVIVVAVLTLFALRAAQRAIRQAG